jgi:hypothetical protein
MATSFVMSLLLARSLFPLYSINHDDAMYVYEARILGDGHLTLPASQQDFFSPWASGVRDGRVVMKYAPPWPAVLAAAEWLTGSMRVAAAAVTAAAVALVYLLAREIMSREDPDPEDPDPTPTVPLVAAGVFALSPLTLLQSGTFLPYLFQLVTGLAFAVGLLAGLRRRSPCLLALSGVALGVGVFARPFDAVLFALPFAAVLVWRLRDRPAELVRAAAAVAAGAVPVVALDLAYNAHTMGSPLTLPFTVTGRYDTMGFGRRGVFAATTFQFSAGDGLQALATNARWVPSWSFGGAVTVALAVVAPVAAARSGRRRSPWLWAVAGVAVAVFGGYLFFWSPYSMSRAWPGVQTLGPFYHLAVLVPVAILGARGLAILWRGTGRSRALAVGSSVVGVALTALALPPKLDANAEVKDRYQAIDDQVRGMRLSDAVLVLPSRGERGFYSPAPFLENRPDLDQPVLYAEDRDKRNFGLFDRFADRRIYQLVQQHAPGDEFFRPSLVPTRLRLDAGARLPLDLRVTNRDGRSHVVAYISDGHRRVERVLDVRSTRGAAYTVPWRLAADAAGPARPAGRSGPAEGGWTFVPAPSDGGMLTVGLAVDDTATVRGYQRWERRIPYRTVGGEIQLIRPGTGFELFAFGDVRHWISTDVDDRLAELPGGA